MRRTQPSRAHGRRSATTSRSGWELPKARELRRTTIMLPHALRAEAMKYAKERGLSLGALIRGVLLDEIGGKRTSFLDKEIAYTGKLPSEAPKHHDDIYAEG